MDRAASSSVAVATTAAGSSSPAATASPSSAKEATTTTTASPSSAKEATTTTTTNPSSAKEATTTTTTASPALAKGIWSQEEHERFLEGMKLFPRGPMRFVAKHVGTRSVRQVQTHAQKYHEKVSRRQRGLRKLKKDSKRSDHRIDDDTMSPWRLTTSIAQQVAAPACAVTLPPLRSANQGPPVVLRREGSWRVGQTRTLPTFTEARGKEGASENTLQSALGLRRSTLPRVDDRTFGYVLDTVGQQNQPTQKQSQAQPSEPTATHSVPHTPSLHSQVRAGSPKAAGPATSSQELATTSATSPRSAKSPNSSSPQSPEPSSPQSPEPSSPKSAEPDSPKPASSPLSKKSDAASSSSEAKETPKFSQGIWSEEEHERFLEGMKLYPRGPAKMIAAHVGTRSVRQVQTHTQKYHEKVVRWLRGRRTFNKDPVRQEHRIDAEAVALWMVPDIPTVLALSAKQAASRRRASASQRMEAPLGTITLPPLMKAIGSTSAVLQQSGARSKGQRPILPAVRQTTGERTNEIPFRLCPPPQERRD